MTLRGEPAKSKRGYSNPKETSAKLATVASAGDLDGVKAQAKVTGGACKNCHDKYRYLTYKPSNLVAPMITGRACSPPIPA